MKLTRRENAYQQIRQMLLEGQLPPGERLSPSALAREIGVSHIPVREAITQLQSEGLVVHVAHRGTFVKGMDRQELVDTIEIRSVLECHAAAQAARRISSSQLQELDACWNQLVQLAKAFDVPPGTDLRQQLADWLLGDLAFHLVLFRAAGNVRAIRVLEETRTLSQMFGHRTDHPAAWADPAKFAAENLRVHQAIYDAVRANDPKAARRAMAAHMRRARKNILARYDWLERQGKLQPSFIEDFPDSMREQVTDIQHDTINQLPGGTHAPGPNDPAK